MNKGWPRRGRDSETEVVCDSLSLGWERANVTPSRNHSSTYESRASVKRPDKSTRALRVGYRPLPVVSQRSRARAARSSRPLPSKGCAPALDRHLAGTADL